MNDQLRELIRHWLHNAKQIKELGEGVSQLVIPNAAARHTGTYTAKATNVGGEAKVLAYVTVRPPTPPPPVLDRSVPPTFVETFGNVALDVGSQMVLECRITGNPAPKVNRHS